MKSEKWIVCRVCLEQPKEAMQTIFSEDMEKDLTRMVAECGGVPIKQFDHYPDKICSNCLKLLRLSYKFRVTCQRSYKHLSRFVAPVEVDTATDNEVANVIEMQHEVLDDNDAQIVLAELSAENITEMSDIIALKMEPEDNFPKEEVQEEAQEEYFEDVYETYDGIVEVLLPENAPSEISAEIEFLDEYDEVGGATQTSDEDFLAVVNAPQRRPIPSAKRAVAGSTTISVSSALSSHSNENQYDDDLGTEVIASKCVAVPPTASRLREQRANKDKNNGVSNYICDVCGNMYHSQGRLTEHIKLHSGIKPHECEICAHRFSQAQQLARHMNTHTGHRPYKCQYCTAAFADLSTRNKHHRIHTKERPYICDVCGKSFTYTNTLKFHKMIHTGEKPHVCDICGKGFQSSNKLRNHKRTHEKRGITIKTESDEPIILENIDVTATAAVTATLMEM